MNQQDFKKYKKELSIYLQIIFNFVGIKTPYSILNSRQIISENTSFRPEIKPRL